MKIFKRTIALTCCIAILFCGCENKTTYSSKNIQPEEQEESDKIHNKDDGNIDTSDALTDEDYLTEFDISTIEAYSGNAFAVVNDNKPYFNDSDLVINAFEKYSKLDTKGRCGVAYANICKELMPTEERGSIGPVKPSGWHTVKYNDYISDNYLYNRCHLIAFCLAGENANEKNLITGTRYMNVEGMLPFEEQVASYVERTNNHVLYRVTPIFEGDNLIASGVLMEAKSVEDDGAGIEFCVYCYNVQPNIVIDYTNGDSRVADDAVPISHHLHSHTSDNGGVQSRSNNVTVPDDNQQTEAGVWVPIHGGTKYHSRSWCSRMKDPKQVSLETAIANGYTPCSKCY